MNKEEFCSKITELLQERLGEGMKVSRHPVRKNNNVILQGLIIQKPRQNISPTIYLEGFFDMYKQKNDMEMIADRILELYEKGCPKKSIDMDFFKDFDKVKDRIVYRLINAERNKALLKEIPHILFLDLAICFYYAFCDEALGEGIIQIHNTHMKMWQTNHSELMKLAEQNTEKLFPAEYLTLSSVIGMDCEEKEEDDSQVYLHILTNTQRCFGAACILYRETLSLIADKLESGFYILPSSVHEVIIVKDTGCEDVQNLHDMVTEVNRTQLEQEEILSDYPYYYDKKERKITRLTEFKEI